MKYSRFALTSLMLLTACSSNEQNFERPLPVIVDKVSQKEVPIYIEAVGSVSSIQTVDVKPQITGILQEVHVSQGQFVHKGDLLYTIDPQFYQAAVEKAKATLQKDQAGLDFAQKKLARYKELIEKDFVAQLSFEQYQSEVASSQAQVLFDQAELEIAKINLSYCSITSPIDGMVGKFQIDPGNLVSPLSPTPLTEIRQLTPIGVQFTIPQLQFQKFARQRIDSQFQFDVILPTQTDPIEKGEVTFVDNHVDLATGTILLKGEVPNRAKSVWPGEFVTVRMLVRKDPEALIVPFAAVQVGQQGEYVYVLKSDNTVDFRKVVVGPRYGEEIVLKEGVKVGEIIVVDGQINLRPGAKVVVVQPEAE